MNDIEACSDDVLIIRNSKPHLLSCVYRRGCSQPLIQLTQIEADHDRPTSATRMEARQFWAEVKTRSIAIIDRRRASAALAEALAAQSARRLAALSQYKRLTPRHRAKVELFFFEVWFFEKERRVRRAMRSAEKHA